LPDPDTVKIWLSSHTGLFYTSASELKQSMKDINWSGAGPQWRKNTKEMRVVEDTNRKCDCVIRNKHRILHIPTRLARRKMVQSLVVEKGLFFYWEDTHHLERGRMRGGYCDFGKYLQSIVICHPTNPIVTV